MSPKQSKKTQDLQFLPEDFAPSRFEVVVGRGKKCTDHLGNQRLRSIVRTRIQEYATANDKTHKTYIISQIFHEIRNRSACGGFVKKDADTGRWYRVADPTARTNIAQSFRDELHDTYRSSKFAKQRRRWGGHMSEDNNNSTDKTKLPAAEAVTSVKSMVYPTLMMNQHKEQEERLACPSSVTGYIRRNSNAQGSSSISDILSSALDVVCADDLLAPMPLLSSANNDVDTFDALLSLTNSQATGNPFEPTPIVTGSFGGFY
ncbi:Nitrilase family, member 2 [Seminavis robusta]|uniref:Nitrilase family, member 2 n=1 Tax=Seminavis robusta TaxID=568900 RepID=A0A9N8E9Y8_9STRA|nr:Nitrilase family, member 2 [Seminavis robusta]|eukprot:Sro710_g190980.1 Nitrilase family, member 2 (261) ;mRNA; r:1790-2572